LATNNAGRVCTLGILCPLPDKPIGDLLSCGVMDVLRVYGPGIAPGESRDRPVPPGAPADHGGGSPC